MAFYRRGTKIDDAIADAALARWPFSRRHPHQRRLQQQVLEAVRRRLQTRKKALSRCTEFDQVMQLVKASAVSGFGPLAVYDTALRIATWMKIKPRHVYLHAGARSGARALGLNAGTRSIDRNVLPSALHELSPEQIEDFLCVYKNELRDARTRGQR